MRAERGAWGLPPILDLIERLLVSWRRGARKTLYFCHARARQEERLVTRRSDPLLPIAKTMLLAALLLAPVTLAQETEWDIAQRIASSEDDSEEFLAASARDPQRWPAGFSYAESSDLELSLDAGHAPQLVALRFPNLQIPQGARISRAVIEFTADSDRAEPITVTIAAQDAVDPQPFIQNQDGQGSFDLSSRETLGATETWSPEPWTDGQAYLSPDISGVIQQLVDSAAWQPGASVVLLIRPGTGAGEALRSAHAFDSDPQLAPRLLVAFEGGEEVGEVTPVEPEEADRAETENRPMPEAPGPQEAPETVEAPAEPAADPAAPEAADAAPTSETADAAPAPETPDAAPAPETPDAAPTPEPDAAQMPVPVEPVTPEEAGEPTAPADERSPEEPNEQGSPDVEVRPVDPDPIVTPAPEEGAPSVWPGPSEEQAQAAEPDQAEAEGEVDVDAQQADQQPTGPTLDEPRRARFQLVPNFTGGLRGSVLLSDYGGGVTVVTVFLDNPDPEVSYFPEIRRGECDGAGRLVVELPPIPGDEALITSLLSVGFDELQTGEFHMRISRTAADFVRVAACAPFGGG